MTRTSGLGRGVVFFAACAAGLTSLTLATLGGTAGEPTLQACDPKLRPQPGPWGYAQRGDRCEGLYEELVSEGSLRPVSLVVSEAPITSNEVQLWWPRPESNAEVALAATSLKPTTFYRMDALVRGTEYRWPTEVVRGLNIGQKELGVIAFTREVVAKTPRRVYLPLAFGARTKQIADQYILRIASPEDLSDVMFGVWQVDTEGRRGPVAVPERSLKRPYYASSVPVSFVFSLIKSPAGLYEVGVSGLRTERTGGSTSTTFLMRHGL